MQRVLEVRPIGVVRSGKGVHFQALHQPDESSPEESVLEIFDGPGMREALRDLSGMERVWLVWWFDRADGWRPLVLPPRGPARRRGVFATRSPHRPNPIGITPVRLLAVEGLRLRLGPCDLLDGTPVLDVKPYVPAFDAFPGTTAGWIDEVEALVACKPRYEVRFSPLARGQLEWLRGEWRVDIEARMQALLARDPTPHRARRIRARPGGLSEVGCGPWRAWFQCDEPNAVVTVLRIEPSFPLRFLLDLTRTRVPDREAQRAFLKRWPGRDGSTAAASET
ncbi:MAG: tRNA (N6-threonylcarbamoyladenosine(37)-N6)-methyltransferase TrmO [Verrucomicrobiota bacterium]|jgi:tRNA-Thr(GGU) m(6)t(6)A37 methyltransferase TsaA